MPVLVTGAQGCIGSWIVKKLLDRGEEVIVYDLDTNPVRLNLIASAAEIARVRFETGRIEDTARVKALVKDNGVTHIVHLAAVLMPFCQKQPVAGGLINVVGTLNVFEAARDADREVRIVYASSSAVWGPREAYQDRSDLTEDEEPKPATHYGVFKHANEGNARVFFATNGLSSVGLRPWAVYGAGRDAGLTSDPTFAIKAAVLGQPYKIRLSGHMDFQYVEDVAEIFIRCLFTTNAGAHVFNLAGHVATIAEFIETLSEVAPQSSGLITFEGPQVPVVFRLSDERLQRYIGGMPQTPLREGIARTFAIFQGLRSEGRLTAQLGA